VGVISSVLAEPSFQLATVTLTLDIMLGCAAEISIGDASDGVSTGGAALST
jgi:hypothetical protein